MPKYTLQQAIDLLGAAGVPHVEIVEDETQSDYNLDTALVAIDTSRTPIILPKIKSEIESDTLKSISGKVSDSLRSEMARITGIPLKELQGLKTKEILEKGIEHYSNLLGKDKEELRKEMDDMMKKHSESESALKSDYESKLNGWESKYQQREIVDVLAAMHTEAKGLPKDANRRALAETFYTLLSNECVLKYNEGTKEIELYDKANPDIRLYTNDQKTTYLKPVDRMVSLYKNQGIWSEDNRDINPQKEMGKEKTQQYKVDENVPKSDLQKNIEGMSAWAAAK